MRRCNGACGLELQEGQAHLSERACVAALKERLELAVQVGRDVFNRLQATRDFAADLSAALYVYLSENGTELHVLRESLKGVPRDGGIEFAEDKSTGHIVIRTCRAPEAPEGQA